MPLTVEPLPFSLIALSIVGGMAMRLLFRAVSRPDTIRAAKRRIAARLLEIRLFGDEPALVWRAQVGLLRANWMYLRGVIVPIAIVSIPAALLFPQLEAFYGRAPLPVGAATVLTCRLRTPFPVVPLPARIEAPPGLRVETPAVRVPAAREISWELRAEGQVSQAVRIAIGGDVATKMLRTGSRGGYLAQIATANPFEWLLHPGEPLVHSPLVASIRIDYPGVRYALGSVELPWETWFAGFSLLAAFLLR